MSGDGVVQCLVRSCLVSGEELFSVCLVRSRSVSGEVLFSVW